MVDHFTFLVFALLLFLLLLLLLLLLSGCLVVWLSIPERNPKR